MTVYAVMTRFYDDGTVRVNEHRFDAPALPQAVSRERPLYDLYLDYFDDAGRARAWAADARKENAS